MAKQQSLKWDRDTCQAEGCHKTAIQHWGALFFCGKHFDEQVERYGF